MTTLAERDVYECDHGDCERRPNLAYDARCGCGSDHGWVLIGACSDHVKLVRRDLTDKGWEVRGYTL